MKKNKVFEPQTHNNEQLSEHLTSIIRQYLHEAKWYVTQKYKPLPTLIHFDLFCLLRLIINRSVRVIYSILAVCLRTICESNVYISIWQELLARVSDLMLICATACLSQIPRTRACQLYGLAHFCVSDWCKSTMDKSICIFLGYIPKYQRLYKTPHRYCTKEFEFFLWVQNMSKWHFPNSSRRSLA